MGIVHHGVPEGIAKTLAKRFQLNTFFETGTFEGGTTEWAIAHFERVITVEASAELFAAATHRLARHENLTRHLGDSRLVLRDLLPTLPPTLFWLDAHWSGGPTAGVDDECPLLGELELIRPYGSAHFVLIDDARLFLEPPPRPHKMEQWPTLDQIIQSFGGGSFPNVRVFDDVILLSPRWAGNIAGDLVRKAR
jgi:hypothetical protein